MVQALDRNPSLKVGILGGGQLALMLAEAAARMGLHPVVLAEGPLSPAAKRYRHSIFGTIHDRKALDDLFSQVNCVTLENEFVDCDLLRFVSKARNIPLFPDVKAIETLQDKLSQKFLLNRLKIPTSPFQALNWSTDMELQKGVEDLSGGGKTVLKWARMGYDGKGVFVVDDFRRDLSRALDFCREAQRSGLPIYAEKKIDFQRELALISVRSIRGELAFYPLVISEQKENRCYQVYGPASQLGVPPWIETQAQEAARRISESLNLVGTFAIEFFLSESLRGELELWVNEIAPRVHNTGHFSQDACATDQFENHWRALLGWPLGKVDSAPVFAMRNFLGPAETVAEALVEAVDLPIPGPQSHLHWYGKSEIRPGRKLGHLNALSQLATEAGFRGLIEELEESHTQWLNQFHEKKGGISWVLKNPNR